MLLDNKFYRLIFNNIAFGIGLVLIVMGIFVLVQTPQNSIKGNNLEELVPNVDISSFKLEYNNMFSAKKYDIEITIPSGSSGLTVANILDESELISAEEFRQYMILFDIENRIKAGKYQFSKDSNAVDILDKILLKRR